MTLYYGHDSPALKSYLSVIMKGYHITLARPGEFVTKNPDCNVRTEIKLLLRPDGGLNIRNVFIILLVTIYHECGNVFLSHK